jgi:hypothetical protein
VLQQKIPPKESCPNLKGIHITRNNKEGMKNIAPYLLAFSMIYEIFQEGR